MYLQRTSMETHNQLFSLDAKVLSENYFHQGFDLWWYKDLRSIIKNFDEYQQKIDTASTKTLEHHILMVLYVFERYFANKFNYKEISADFFRTVLSLHDIGKPEAISIWSWERQHEFTVVKMKSILDKLEYSASEIDLAISLVSIDSIWEYLQSKIDLKEAFNQMNVAYKKQKLLKYHDWCNLLVLYYTVDASSYIIDWSVNMKDSIFSIDKGWSISFIEDFWKKIDILLWKKI